MRSARICILTQDTDPLECVPNNPAPGPGRVKLTHENFETVKEQWRQCVYATKNEHTRRHFEELMPVIDARIRKDDAENIARAARQREGEARGHDEGKNERRVDIRTNTELGNAGKGEGGKRQRNEGIGEGQEGTAEQTEQQDTKMGVREQKRGCPDRRANC